jgi:hypothetical protein
MAANKNRIESRLKEIDAELAAIKHEAKLLSAAVSNPKIWSRLISRRDKQDSSATASSPADSAPSSEPTAKKALQPAPPGAMSGAPLHAPAVGEASARTGPTTLLRENNERFANYFVTGSLQDMRPIRHEQRIMRNRAIAMIILAALMLIWVLSLI